MWLQCAVPTSEKLIVQLSSRSALRAHCFFTSELYQLTEHIPYLVGSWNRDH